MTRIPCPQAARIIGIPPLSSDPWMTAIEVLPEEQRPGLPPMPEPLPPAPEPTHRWPYHLPRWNAIDAAWWAALASAAYFPTDAWVRRIAGWAGTVSRVLYRAPTDPAIVGYALVELPDCWLCVVPGTSSDEERNAYLLTHALAITAQDPEEDWTVNSTWYLRAAIIWLAAVGWPYPPAKPLIAVGHSAGGAEASLVAVFRDQAAVEVRKTAVSLGAPIWGSPSLSSRIVLAKSPQVIELSNLGDPVTYMPPPWSLVDAMRLGYRSGPRPEYVRIGAMLDVDGHTGARQRMTSGSANDLGPIISGILSRTIDYSRHKILNYTDNFLAWARAFAVEAGASEQVLSLQALVEEMDEAMLEL